LPGLSSAGQGMTSAAGSAKDMAGLYTIPYENMMNWYKLLESGNQAAKAAKAGSPGWFAQALSAGGQLVNLNYNMGGSNTGGSTV